MAKDEIKFLDLASQYASIKDRLTPAISHVLETASFIGGAEIREFEAAFASYQQVAHCVGVGNGTDALEIAIEALDLDGGEILVPAHSFIASSEAVTRAGSRVKFCDIDLAHYGLSLDDAKAKITTNTVAIMPVHLYGHPCNMSAVNEFADKHGLAIIEDCAQAHGATWRSRSVGSFGNVSAFSFYPGKNLGAYGDAGAVLTDHESIATRSRKIANHGRITKYGHEFEGRNSRLDTLQAAILLVKLSYLESWTEKRRAIAGQYIKGLQGVGDLILPVEHPDARHVYHLFVVRTKARDKLRQFLTERHIQTGIHYPNALHRLEAYEYLGEMDENPAAEELANTCLSLPMGEHLSDDDIGVVCRNIREFFGAPTGD